MATTDTASSPAKAAGAQAGGKPELRTEQSQGQVAVFKPSRLPYHPEIGTRFNIDKSAWKALTDAIFPSAKTPDAVVLALSYCKARGLDPFKRTVHIVPTWDQEQGRYIETIWPGIAEHRTTAARTGTYAGHECIEFGPAIEKTFEGEIGKEGKKRKIKKRKTKGKVAKAPPRLLLQRRLLHL